MRLAGRTRFRSLLGCWALAGRLAGSEQPRAADDCGGGTIAGWLGRCRGGLPIEQRAWLPGAVFSTTRSNRFSFHIARVACEDGLSRYLLPFASPVATARSARSVKPSTPASSERVQSRPNPPYPTVGSVMPSSDFAELDHLRQVGISLTAIFRSGSPTAYRLAFRRQRTASVSSIPLDSGAGSAPIAIGIAVGPATASNLSDRPGRVPLAR